MAPARILERYRLLEPIAAGATARVLRARDEQLDRDVAVKLLHPHLLPDDTSRRRLAAEARAAASLSHPGIATVYDVDTNPTAPALVMELVDGESLAERLARAGPLPGDEVARLGAEGPRRSTTRTGAASCTATSSPATSCSSAERVARGWWTSASPTAWRRAPSR